MQIRCTGLIAAMLIAGTAFGVQPTKDVLVTIPRASKEASISHLPEVIQNDITAWRNKLATAKCLKVVLETDQTWAAMYDLDEQGSPRIIQREQLSFDCWMTPDTLWFAAFAYKNGMPDRTKPIYQMYWSGSAQQVWERIWDSESAEYRVHRYKSSDEFGPGDANFGSLGCIYGALTESWLAGSSDLSQRSISLRSMALMRKPNLPMVPPDPSKPGVWLDVFADSVPRNQFDVANELYRRQDFMLLARNDSGEPEVREWRTIVLNDPSSGGMKPQEITGIRRQSYTFYDAPPSELEAAIEAFVSEVDAAME